MARKKEKAPKRIWDNCKQIGFIQKAPKLRINLELVARDGIKYLNIREFYCRKDEVDNYKPSLKGIVIPIDMVHTDENEQATSTPVALPFIGMLTDAIKEADNFELYDEANAVYAQPKED